MDEMERMRRISQQREAYLEQKRQKIRQRQRYVRRLKFFLVVGACVVGASLIAILLLVMFQKPSKQEDFLQQTEKVESNDWHMEETENTQESVSESPYVTVGDAVFLSGFEAKETSATLPLPTGSDELISEYALLINENTNEIVAQKNAKERVNPASMTKILTILVAAEHVENMEAKVEITREVTDYVYVNDCSAVGYEVGEKAPVKDLFYGTILPSGADAAVTLAKYVSGSQEAFVDLMNEKIKELGLSETSHFTNCVGLYDENHYCTIYDMAMILKAALQNDFCRDVLSAHTFTTTKTKQHPKGITVSNLFLRRIEDRDSGGLVVGAKTGFVNQSGSCAASYQISDSGTPYICVTAKSSSSWQCIYDHVYIYKNYAS